LDHFHAFKICGCCNLGLQIPANLLVEDTPIFEHRNSKTCLMIDRVDFMPRPCHKPPTVLEIVKCLNP
jgi:hypothetical protein